MSSSSTAGCPRWGHAPLLDCPDCHVPLIRIQSKQPKSLNEWFVKCPNNIKGDPTMCGRIWAEKQYESYVRSEAQKQGKQVALHVGDDIADLKQQMAGVNQRLDSVVNDVRKLMMQPPVSQISDQKQESSRKLQIVLDVYVLVGVLVGVLLGVVAHLVK